MHIIYCTSTLNIEHLKLFESSICVRSFFSSIRIIMKCDVCRKLMWIAELLVSILQWKWKMYLFSVIPSNKLNEFIIKWLLSGRASGNRHTKLYVYHQFEMCLIPFQKHTNLKLNLCLVFFRLFLSVLCGILTIEWHKLWSEIWVASNENEISLTAKMFDMFQEQQKTLEIIDFDWSSMQMWSGCNICVCDLHQKSNNLIQNRHCIRWLSFERAK